MDYKIKIAEIRFNLREFQSTPLFAQLYLKKVFLGEIRIPNGLPHFAISTLMFTFIL